MQDLHIGTLNPFTTHGRLGSTGIMASDELYITCPGFKLSLSFYDERHSCHFIDVVMII